MNFKKIFFVITIIISSTFIFAKEYSEEDAAQIRSAIVAKAKTYIGCPYRSGAIGPDSFDCSGLIFTVYRESAGIQLPRSVKAIYSYSTIVSKSELEEGDLVFFKTTGDGTISHVGIYIGRNQFIHAASDGSNTGVIVSSLNEKYYKNVYSSVGRTITSKKKLNQTNNQNSQNQSNNTNELGDSQFSSTSSQSSSFSPSSKSSFASNLDLDSILYCDWNLWLNDTFNFNFRGIDLTTVAKYRPWKIQPGLGCALKWNNGTNVFQIPIFLNLSFNDYFYIYGGPVMNFGYAVNPGTSKRLNTNFFGGIIGFGVSTPKIEIGKIYISFVQDILYNIYTRKNDSIPSFSNAINEGLTLRTGLRVTLPLKNVLQ